MGRLALIALIALAAAAPTPAAAASLYTGPKPRPGPDLLYEKRPTSPQLTNRGPWRAKPILVSGATAYRKGEFIYQDFLYDDSGARLTSDPEDPRTAGNLFSKHNGTYTYPTAPDYANNAADLVELRVKRLRRKTAFRVTLNTLKDPALVAFTIAIGGDEDAETVEFPFGANVSAPAELFLTVHPDGDETIAELTTPDGDTAAELPARVDMRRRQVEVRVPRADWNPRRRTVHLAAGVGLWDAEAGTYLLPGASANESTPGGAGGDATPAGFFNVAFRGDEPFPSPTDNEQAIVNAAWWRDRAQGSALAAGDISEFYAEVSFRKLARRVRDNSDVPRRGAMDRIYASRFELAQGADFSVSCFPSDTAACEGQYQGRLQPYAIYIPKGPRPKRGWGLTLLLHSLSANYNQYLGTRNQSQFGDRGRGSIVITPEARGPDGFYENYAAADVFDVWSEVASRFKLDPGWTVTTGYSMGAIGSFRLGAHYPDLFARIQPTVGDEGSNEVLASLRNVPVLMWNNHGDELVNNLGFQETADALDELGYRYELNAFQPCAHPDCSALFPNHLQLAINDQYEPAADFLGRHRVERNPAHVTYVVNPARDYPDLELRGDSAYWLSRLRLRDGASQGEIDAVSHGFGVGDPEPSDTEGGTGTLEGGNLGSLLYTFQRRTWGEPPAQPRADRVEVTATGVESAVLHVRRARVSCDAEVEVESTDGPLALRLGGCGRTVTSSG